MNCKDNIVIATNPIGSNIQSASAQVRPQLSVYDPENKLAQTTSHRVTFKEQTAKDERKTLDLIRNTAVNGTTILSLGTTALALAARLFSRDPEKGMAANLLNFAKTSTKATFMTYGGFAALRGYGENDAGVALTQALEVGVPALTADPCNLTMNRGLGIGLGTFVLEAKKFFSKSHYGTFGESLQHLKQAVAKLGTEIRTNPITAMVNFRQGPGAMIMGLITASAPIIHKLTGIESLSRLLRHIPGMALELGKVNQEVLQKGAPMYFTSGVLMLGSSMLNLLGGFTNSKNTQKTIELGTWLANIAGRRCLVESMRQSELAQDHNAKPVTMVEAIKLSAKNLFGWGGVEANDAAVSVKPAVVAVADNNTKTVNNSSAKNTFSSPTSISFSNPHRSNSISRGDSFVTAGKPAPASTVEKRSSTINRPRNNTAESAAVQQEAVTPTRSNRSDDQRNISTKTDSASSSVRSQSDALRIESRVPLPPSRTSESVSNLHTVPLITQ